MKKLYFVLVTLIVTTNAFSQARFEWVESVTTNNFNKSRVAMDPDGNLVVAGYFSSFASFGADTVWSYGTEDIVVAKIDTANDLLWIIPIGGNWYDALEKLAVDDSGNVYVSVHVQNDTNMPDTTYTASQQYQVIKLGSDGNYLDHLEFPSVVAITTLGTDLYTAHNDVISKYNIDLQLVWTKSVTPAGSVNFSSSAFARGDIYASTDGTLAVVGYEMSAGAMMLDTVSFATSGGSFDEVVVVKMDTSGSAHWVRLVGATTANSVSADNTGAVYAAPYIASSITFNGVLYTNPLAVQGFLALLKYNSDGSEAWGLGVYAGNATPGFTDLVCTPQNDIAMCGTYENYGIAYSLVDTFRLGGTFGQMFVFKANDQGDVLWAKHSTGGNASSTMSSIVTDGNDNFYVAGAAYDSQLGCIPLFPVSQIFLTKIIEQPEILPAPNFIFNSTQLSVTFTNQTQSATTYFWDFDDGNTSTEMSPTHTFSQAGTYNVCLTATNPCGDSTFCTSITVTDVSIHETNTPWNLQLYPNPSNDLVNILITSPDNDVYHFELTDIVGKRIIDWTNDNYSSMLDLSKLAQGEYLLTVFSSKHVQTFRVMKQ